MNLIYQIINNSKQENVSYSFLESCLKAPKTLLDSFNNNVAMLICYRYKNLSESFLEKCLKYSGYHVNRINDDCARIICEYHKNLSDSFLLKCLKKSINYGGLGYTKSCAYNICRFQNNLSNKVIKNCLKYANNNLIGHDKDCATAVFIHQKKYSEDLYKKIWSLVIL